MSVQVIQEDTEATDVQVSYEQQDIRCLSDFYDI